jgi:farnesyl-diphosphate farnesyltransferase
MNESAGLKKEALHMLEQTSRTFFIPIMRLDEGLQEAVASAYLCMRAIDEIEDHPELGRGKADPVLCSESCSTNCWWMSDGIMI